MLIVNQNNFRYLLEEIQPVQLFHDTDNLAGVSVLTVNRHKYTFSLLEKLFRVINGRVSCLSNLAHVVEFIPVALVQYGEKFRVITEDIPVPVVWLPVDV